jgi:hypothetical protein
MVEYRGFCMVLPWRVATVRAAVSGSVAAISRNFSLAVRHVA